MSVKNSGLILLWGSMILSSCQSPNVEDVKDTSSNKDAVIEFNATSQNDKEGQYGKMELLDSHDSIEIYRELINEPQVMDRLSRYNIYKVNKDTGNKMKILTTNEPSSYGKFDMQAKKFVEVCIDSIPAVTRAYIIEFNPLKVILEGCPDSRNEYSFLIDVKSSKAYYVPATSGYLGPLEEGLLLFRSYTYNTGIDAAGRHTVLNIFSREGKLLDSIDLEYLQNS